MTASRVNARFLVLATAVGAFAPTVHAAPPRAVIELFHEPGLLVMPPADKLLATLAKDPDLIALSLPVDYWDQLGWKDTFAKHAFTATPAGLCRHARRRAGLYAPGRGERE